MQNKSRASRSRQRISEGTMPLYEYLCSNCAHQFERIVKFSDDPVKICPKCGKSTLEQMISAPAVQFKGTGWYVTDYAHKNTSQGSSAPSKSENGSDGGSNGHDSSSGESASASSGSSEKSAESAPSTPPSGGSASSSTPAPSGDSR